MAKKRKARKPNAKYRLLKPRLATVKRVLALDPGSKNMGISCVGVDAKGKVVVLANSIMTNPITSLVDNLNQSIEVYLAEVARWVRMYKPDGFIMERFQSRGGMAGPLIELVSGMILCLCTEYRDKPCKLITAATWKNQFHRKFSEVELNDLYKICRTTPHQLDATLIGCYGLEVGLPSFDYDFQDVIAQTELSSALPLRKIRGA